jgi:hypothetical protein
MNQRTYKIRSFSNGKNRKGDPFVNYSLTIPSHIAEKLPREMQFYCELTEDGLLFKPVPPDQEQVVLPPWAVSENGSEAEKPKRTPRKRPTTTKADKVASTPRKRPSRAKKTAEAKPDDAPAAEPTAGDGEAEQQPEAAAAA